MPVASAVVKILIFGDETIDFDGKDPNQPIYVYQHGDDPFNHLIDDRYDFIGAADCSLNYLSFIQYPDSYFTLLDVMDVDYIPPEVPSIGEDINRMCYPAYGNVETDDVAIATEIINRETDILNGVISNAMLVANSGNAPRKITPTDAVYGVATKAKLIISTATNTFNQNTSAAKVQLNAGILAQAKPTVVEFKPLDPELQMVYAKAIRFLENGIGKGKVPKVEKNLATGQRGKVEGIQTNENLWINYAYPDNKGNPTVGFGHLISFSDTIIPLSPKNPYVLRGKVSSPITGFWPKSTPKFNTPAKLQDQSGISDDAVEAIFIEDIAVTVTQVQQLLGVERWNYLADNDQCMLIVLIDLQFNTGVLYKFKTLLSGDGTTSGIDSGLGLRIGSKAFFHFTRNGIYSYDLWTKPKSYSGTQQQYISAKKTELKEESHRKESQVGTQRNNAIYQLFIDKNRFSSYPWKNNKGVTSMVNYWTLCNPDNIDLTKYMKYN